MKARQYVEDRSLEGVREHSIILNGAQLTGRGICFDESALTSGFKAHSFRGIGRYVRELRTHFEKLSVDRRVPVNFFSAKELEPAFGLQTIERVLPFGKQTFKQQFVYPFSLGKKLRSRGKVLHFPAHMDAPAWCPMPYILTVLDLIPLVCSDLYAPEQANWRFKLARALELRAIRNACHLIAISENTAQDVVRELKIPRDRISVTPLGVREEFFSIQWGNPSARESLRSRLKVGSETPIVMYLGGIDPRKNWPALLSLAGELSRLEIRDRESHSRIPAPVICLVGKIADDKEYPKLCAEIAKRELGAVVKCVGFLTDAELVDAYAGSDVFFFPSLYEGFGLPPLEALAAGLPVVSSNRSSMPEVLGSAAALINPEKIVDATSEVLKVITDKLFSKQLSVAGRTHARSFSWESTASKTLDVYSKVLGSICP